MGHSDEWTFADYFRYEKEIYRAIISAAVLASGLRNMIPRPRTGKPKNL